MNKIFILSAISLTLAACASKPQVDNSQIMHYSCPQDISFAVKYSEDGKTATLFDATNKIYVLRLAKVANGTQYANDQGVSINQRNQNLLVELIKGKPVRCTKINN